MMSEREVYKPTLSPSTLSIYLECKLCFWVRINLGIKRPRGPVSDLPNKIDRLVKRDFDNFRGSLPPELVGRVRGVLFPDLVKIGFFRDWRSGLRTEIDGIKVMGVLDDLLLDGQTHLPLDFKAREAASAQFMRRFYQHQLDIYGLVLEKNGFKTDNEAYVVFFDPIKMDRNGWFRWSVEPRSLPIDLGRAEKLIQEASEFLKGPSPKEWTPSCEYCNFAKQYAGVYLKKINKASNHST